MNTHKRSDYLTKKIIPFDVYKVKNVDTLLFALESCGFQGRNLGKGLSILSKMVENKECVKVLTLSGAMVPAGMGELICALIEKKIIDVIVTTGANISHDLVDSSAHIGHFIGDSNVSDDDLYNFKINRIYDVFLPEENYDKAEKELLKILEENFENKNIEIAPSDFLKIIGENLQNSCILSIAAKHDVPIFVPALSDSEFALNLIKFTVQNGYDFKFLDFDDVKKFADIIRDEKESGTIIIGGGVPRNWAQQVFPYLDNLEDLRSQGKDTGFNYSVRIHTATEYDGGLSGCTISESKSWGKYSLDSTSVSIWCDATIAFPILVTGLFQRLNLIE